MVIGEAPKRAKSLAEEALAVLPRIGVGITENELFRLVDDQLAINPVLFRNCDEYFVAISTQNTASIAVLGNFGIDILDVFADLKLHPSVAARNECYDWWIV